MLRAPILSMNRVGNKAHAVRRRRWLLPATYAAWSSICVVLCASAHGPSCLAEELMASLPKPHFHPQPDDPSWLVEAVQFHGHLGPWAAAGLRMGMAARQAAGAQGYFDLEVEARGPLDRPPCSCLLDGLQVSTGATLGKRNLHWVASEELVVRLRNLKTGAIAEVRPTEQLRAWLGTIGPHSHDQPASDEHRAAHSGHKPAHAPRAAHAPAPHAAEAHPDEDAASAAPPADQASLEATARRIATAAQDDILVVRLIAPGTQPAGK